MGIKEKSGEESETWEESEAKVKVFLTKSLLREHIGSERKKRKKEGPS